MGADVSRRDGTSMRVGAGLRVHRRRIAGGEVPALSVDQDARRRTATAPHGSARLRVQLVARRRGQRVPERLRGHRGRRAQMGVVDGVAREHLRARHAARSVHDVGGLGTMCETFHGRVENLDYKTMRYPGHMDLMNFFFHELLMRQRRDLAGEILTNAKPAVTDDVVYMHVASEGDIDGQLRRLEFVRAYYPREFGGRAQHGDRVDHRQFGRRRSSSWCVTACCPALASCGRKTCRWTRSSPRRRAERSMVARSLPPMPRPGRLTRRLPGNMSAWRFVLNAPASMPAIPKRRPNGGPRRWDGRWPISTTMTTSRRRSIRRCHVGRAGRPREQRVLHPARQAARRVTVVSWP